MHLSVLLQRMQSIPGWFSVPEAELLFHCATRALRETSVNHIVEIGSYHGRSTIILGAAAQLADSDARVFAIDPHNGEMSGNAGGTHLVAPSLASFLSNVEGAGLRDVVVSVERFSFEVTWDTPIALMFIDGLHDYRSVSQDFSRFEPWIVPGGYVAFHDCPNPDYPDVHRFVGEVMSSGRFSAAGTVESLSILRKLP